MKRILLLAVAVFLTAPLSAADKKGRTGDEEAIKKVFADFAAAWEKGDPKAMSMFWAEDGDLINPAGRVAKGRAEVEKLFVEERPTNPPRITFTVNEIRFLKRDVAVYNASFELSGVRGADGKEMTMKGLITCVMAKKNGKWWTVAARPMVPLGPRGQM